MHISISIFVTICIELFGCLFVRDWYRNRTKPTDTLNVVINYLGLAAGILIILIGISFPILFYVNNKNPLPIP